MKLANTPRSAPGGPWEMTTRVGPSGSGMAPQPHGKATVLLAAETPAAGASAATVNSAIKQDPGSLAMLSSAWVAHEATIGMTTMATSMQDAFVEALARGRVELSFEKPSGVRAYGPKVATSPEESPAGEASREAGWAPPAASMVNRTVPPYAA